MLADRELYHFGGCNWVTEAKRDDLINYQYEKRLESIFSESVMNVESIDANWMNFTFVAESRLPN